MYRLHVVRVTVPRERQRDRSAKVIALASRRRARLEALTAKPPTRPDAA
jgi:hypothetical protein